MLVTIEWREISYGEGMRGLRLLYISVFCIQSIRKLTHRLSLVCCCRNIVGVWGPGSGPRADPVREHSPEIWYGGRQIGNI